MTFNKNHLVNVITLPYPMLFSLPNEYRVKVTELGIVNLTSKITLSGVLYAPSFKYNLISINSLVDHLK